MQAEPLYEHESESRMIRRAVFQLLLALPASFGMIACADKPTVDRSPVIHLLIASPDSIGPSDSTIVTCVATDPDGDALVFDWETDARLFIPGRPPNEYYYYNSPYNTQIFYPGPVSLSPADTAWVRCFARDRRGGGAVALIHILVSH